MSNWMVYGANGYTGELIARKAAEQGLKPVLAGRNGEKVKALATELGLEARVFGLDSKAEIVKQLEGIDAVTHCAGPFSATAEPMMKACIQAKTHYTDITGEIDVFELSQSLHEQAKAAGVVLCPGVGFDVIPTDCVAAALKATLPDATHLTLGFDSRSGFSPGTAKTSVEGIAAGNKVRRNGQIETVGMGKLTRKIDFGDGEKVAMSIPWGDISTAYSTTGIANIEVYIPSSPSGIKQAQRANLFRPILKFKPVQKLIQNQIGKKVRGPSEKTRAKLITYVWGEATNAAGETKVARIKTANGYDVTWQGGILVPQKLLSDAPEGGAYTPSKLMGYQFVESLDGSEKIIIE